MDEFVNIFRIKLRRSRYLINKVNQIVEWCKDIQKNACYGPPDELYEINQQIYAIRNRCVISNLTYSNYKLYNLALKEIEKRVVHMSENGSSIWLYSYLHNFEMEVDNYNEVFKFYKTCIVDDPVVVPELDVEYNERAKKFLPFAYKMYPPDKNTLHEMCHGAKLFLPEQKSKKYVIFWGCFIPDSAQVETRQLHEYKDIDAFIQAKSGYEKQVCSNIVRHLTLRDFHTNTVEELKTLVRNSYNDVLQFEKKNFNDIHKTFNQCSIQKQRRIILLLLCGNEQVNKYALSICESISGSREYEILIDTLGMMRNKLKSIEVVSKRENASFESSNEAISYHNRIMMMKVETYVKTKALEKLKEANSNRESGTKAQQYIDGLLRIPFGVYKEEPIFNNSDESDRRKYLSYVKDTLETCVHGHDEAKKHIRRLMAQWMSGKMNGTVFGFYGPPGTGKTTLAKNGFAKCLLDENGSARPIAFLPLGGSSGGSFLEGHGYTYMGSSWGRIVDVLMEVQCMNPIIYIDELDKVSMSERGQEIISILTHLTDPSQNTEFNDKYFSNIKIDVSKVIFIFSYNDPMKIDKVLRDRITEIKTNSLSNTDKIIVTKQFILPEILENIGLSQDDVILNDDAIEYVINSYTCESGARKLKERMYDIYRDLNLSYLLQAKQKQFEVSKEYVDELFAEKSKTLYTKPPTAPKVGVVNGLYASTIGVGGVTLIEVQKTVGENMDLMLTGSQGDVMKESMHCAKTLAWNLLTDKPRDWKQHRLHIHCPEAATAKDGPSAGITITTAIFSCLSNKRVNNFIAMTGEVDLSGNVHAVGGIDAKLFGAIQAGITTVLIPSENKRDLQNFISKHKEVAESVEVKLVDNIQDVIRLSIL